MKALSLIPVLLLAACAKEGPGVSAAADLSNGIVNGRAVAAGTAEARPIALLANAQTKTVCTATLIGEDTLLTAAHCVSIAPKDETQTAEPARTADLFVIFGVDVSRARPESVRRIAKFVRHEKYVGNPKAAEMFDIAVVRLAGQRPAGTEIALLSAGTEKKGDLIPFRAVGYGRTNGLTNDPEASKDAGVGLLRMTDLSALFIYEHRREFIVDQTRTGICLGDSGGPALVRRDDGKLVVIGVVSRVLAPGVSPERSREKDFDFCSKISAYSAVAGFRDWIADALTQVRAD